MTFSYMVHMFATCEWYFPVILSAVHRGLSPVTEKLKLSRKDADFYVLRYVFQSFQGVTP